MLVHVRWKTIYPKKHHVLTVVDYSILMQELPLKGPLTTLILSYRPLRNVDIQKIDSISIATVHSLDS